MEKETLRCKTCKNKVGESQNGITTFRHKGRSVEVNTGIYPCMVTTTCEHCKTDTSFEICHNAVVEKP